MIRVAAHAMAVKGDEHIDGGGRGVGGASRGRGFLINKARRELYTEEVRDLGRVPGRGHGIWQVTAERLVSLLQISKVGAVKGVDLRALLNRNVVFLVHT